MNRSSSKLVICSILIAVFLVLTGQLWSQPGIDQVLAEKELAVMKSVISTSLSMTRKKLQGDQGAGKRSRWYSRAIWYGQDSTEAGIDGYYLHGQGIIFTIPSPCLSSGNLADLEELAIRIEEIQEGSAEDSEYAIQEVKEMEMELKMQQQELELLRRDMRTMPSPPEPPDPPEPPEVPDEPKEIKVIATSKNGGGADRKITIVTDTVRDLKEKLTDLREKNAKRNEQAARERAAIKQELIGVVAAYGDTLTQVKENEYINIIMKDDCDRFDLDSSGAARTVLSVRKSDISAYRSGQITLDQLKSRFVEY